jgi:nitroreductase
MTDGITMTDEVTMTNAVIECILSRSAAKYYDPAATLSDNQIRELVRIGTTAPTSFHLQNWRFIAVRTPEAKARLRPIAWNQPAITEAAVTFIVCGQLADSSVIPQRLAPLVEAGNHAGKDGAGLGNPRTRSVYGIVRGGGASGKLAAEAAPSGGRCAGIRIDPRRAALPLRTPESAREKYLERARRSEAIHLAACGDVDCSHGDGVCQGGWSALCSIAGQLFVPTMERWKMARADRVKVGPQGRREAA